jgi:hypothetical protein
MPPDAMAMGDASDASVGPFKAPGLVVEVAHAGVVANGLILANEVRPIMTRGMIELTGQSNETDAWRTLFSPSDVVAIKVNPFGYPKFYSQPATVAEIVRGLNLAGIKNENMIVYDRYTEYLEQVDYPTGLPVGVKLASAVSINAMQTALDNYDASTFVEFPKVDVGLDSSIAQNRRSYLASVISTYATKVINVPVLKSHWTAGLTACLKNMTYGLVNNTARSHTSIENWTHDFLPGVATIKTLRDKVVLNIADLLIACYDGGPDPSDQIFEYQSLMFATDPVAADRICWNILNAERAKHGLPPVESDPTRQPDYILRCGAAGLGVSDINAIQHRQFQV